MAERDSNRGACSHPCRWKYHLVEEKRPGEYYPVYEDEKGTYIYNSKDLCMIEHIPELVKAGIYSFKIEGRMKSSFYVATVVSAYRQAIDAYLADPDNYRFDPEWLIELSKASHRNIPRDFILIRPQVQIRYIIPVPISENTTLLVWYWNMINQPVLQRLSRETA